MSLRQVFRDHRGQRQTVEVGGEYDRGGVQGYVMLTARPSRQHLRPADARRVARTLIRFADQARKPALLFDGQSWYQAPKSSRRSPR